MTKSKPPAYRVLTGLNYGPDGATRAEPEDVVTDLPSKSVAWLLEQGHIEKIKEG